jgi:DNA-binding NarL/FixJ family response regulator
MSDSIRLIVVDDQQLFREAIKTLLTAQPDFIVIGEGANGCEALDLVEKLQPDIVLMDLRMPTMDGVQATREIKAKYPATRVIILTTFDDDTDLFEGLKAGAAGYVLKEISSEQLYSAIRAAARGELFLLPSATARVVAEFSRLSSTDDTSLTSSPAEVLTKREIEILKLVSTGVSNKEIGEILYITEGTVKNHMTNILNKLDVRERLQAVVKARHQGLL